MPMGTLPTERRVLRAALDRTAVFFSFWIIIAGFKPADLVIGLLTSVGATWTSLRLLPPGQWSLRPIALARLAIRFPYQSLVAGFDVAWRALDPRLPLRPGLVNYRSRLQAGVAQDTFCTITSLLPGTLPCGSDKGDGLIVHCLDTDQPVVEQLTVQEALLIDTIGGLPQ